MPALVTPAPSAGQLRDRVEDLTAQLPPVIAAALWIVADDINRAHEIVQNMEDPTGSAWHAIIHRREGDFWNSQYWWRKAGNHPGVPRGGGRELVETVESLRTGELPRAVVEAQRAEWRALFE